MPNADLVETLKLAGKEAYRLTPVGLSQLQSCAKYGMQHEEIAKLFGVSRQWIEKQLAANGLAAQQYSQGEGLGVYELREAMHKTAVAGDAQMLKFMGERRLKMKAEVEHKHEHTVRVIGAQPNYKLSAQDWQAQHAPPGVIDTEFKELPSPESVDGVQQGDPAAGVCDEPAGEEGGDGGDQ